MDAQLRKLNLQEHYQRFAAIDGRKLQHRSSHRVRDEVACLMSHVEALRSLMKYGKCGHILEDDTELTSYVDPVMTSLIGNGIFDKFDIVYTEINVVPVPDVISLFKDDVISLFKDKVGRNAFGTLRGITDFSIVNLKNVNFSGSNSYFVGSHTIERIIKIFDSEVRNGPILPVDLCLSKNIKQGTIRAACVIPFLTCADFDLNAETTIEGREKQSADKSLAIELLRHLFFVDMQFDERLSGLLNQLVGKEMSCLSHQEYLDAILEKLKNKPVME